MSFKMLLDAVRVAGGVNELLELLKDNENKTIFDFDFSDPDDPSYEKNMLIALNGLCKNVKTQESVGIFSKQLLNLPSINEKKLTAEKRNELLKFIKNQFHLRLTNSSYMIGLFTSLLNHSCIPNAIAFEFDEKHVVIVMRPIEAGEQIFVSYGAFADTDTIRERGMILKQYPFKCDCGGCIHNYPRPFPRKDKRFVAPRKSKVLPADAIKQFKKNCQYIDKNSYKNPCFEVSQLISHNVLLVECIAGNTAYLGL